MSDAAQRLYEQFLVVRFQAGDDQAFAEIVQRYNDRLGYYVRRLLGEAARQDAQSIIEEGQEDKKRIVEEARTVATTEAADIKTRAEREIVLAKRKALAEVKDEAAKLGMLIAERVVGAEVDAAKHQELVASVIASYEKTE